MKRTTTTHGTVKVRVTRGDDTAPRSASQTVSDAEFMHWAQSFKPCKYCGVGFYGPVCSCEVQA